MGTSAVRTLETVCAGKNGAALAGYTDLFIYPGYRFQVVDALITNFHLPRSTPLLLVCAFAGKEAHRGGLPGGHRAGLQVLQLWGCDVYLMSALTIAQADGQARLAVLHTGHGPVETPVFMPVGTQGTVKAILHRDLKEMGVQMVLANAYHLYLRPGDALDQGYGRHPEVCRVGRGGVDGQRRLPDLQSRRAAQDRGRGGDLPVAHRRLEAFSDAREDSGGAGAHRRRRLHVPRRVRGLSVFPRVHERLGRAYDAVGAEVQGSKERLRPFSSASFRAACTQT